MTLYEILSIAVDSTPEQIHSAFLRIAKEHHPDLKGEDEAGPVFIEAKRAHDLLMNPESRRVYDETGLDDKDDRALAAVCLIRKIAMEIMECPSAENILLRVERRLEADSEMLEVELRRVNIKSEVVQAGCRDLERLLTGPAEVRGTILGVVREKCDQLANERQEKEMLQGTIQCALELVSQCRYAKSSEIGKTALRSLVAR